MPRPTLVLCPGLLNDAALWDHQVRTLADLADVQVPDLTGGDSIPALARSVLNTAPDRFVLGGLSMGGYVAFEILRQAPERVAALVLLNTSARADAEAGRQRRLEMMDIVRRGGFEKLLPQLMASQIYAPNIDRLKEDVLAMNRRIGSDAFLRQQTAILNRIDSRDGLANIACPTLVVGGRQDGLTTPDIMAEIADGISGARLVVVEEAGHFSPLEQPQAVSAVLRLWLQGL